MEHWTEMSILQAGKRSWNHWTKLLKKLTLQELVLVAVRERLKFMVFADSEAVGSRLLLSNMLGAIWIVTLEVFS